MSIWNYPDRSSTPHEFADLVECPYCCIPLQRLFWEQRLSRSHNENYDDLQGLTCRNCGWWKVIRETGIWNPARQTSHIPKFAYQKFCQAGCLRNFDPVDLTVPFDELYSILWASHTGGFAYRPPGNKDILVRVFASQGYQPLFITTSIEGDMIAILVKGDERIGIMVKDREATIVVEQILAMTGALVYNGNTRGIFVKTSRAQTSLYSTTRLLAAKGESIQVVDAMRLYSALGLVQISSYNSQDDFLNIHALNELVRVKASDGF